MIMLLEVASRNRQSDDRVVRHLGPPDDRRCQPVASKGNRSVGGPGQIIGQDQPAWRRQGGQGRRPQGL